MREKKGNGRDRGQKKKCVYIREKDRYIYKCTQIICTKKKKSTKCFLKISIAYIIYFRKFGY